MYVMYLRYLEILKLISNSFHLRHLLLFVFEKNAICFDKYFASHLAYRMVVRQVSQILLLFYNSNNLSNAEYTNDNIYMVKKPNLQTLQKMTFKLASHKI